MTTPTGTDPLPLKPGMGLVGGDPWDERAVFVVGGGPSLKGRKLDRLREDGWVLGVNRAAELIPVDATFTMDRTMLTEKREWLTEMSRRHEVYAAVPPGEDLVGIAPGVTYLELQYNGKGASRDPRAIFGTNSGYGALNLAVLKGARRIYLLGFDLHKPPAGEPIHWHGGYPWSSETGLTYYQRWAKRFDDVPATLPPGVEVWNCNPDSAVRAFPFCPYEEIGL